MHKIEKHHTTPNTKELIFNYLWDLEKNGRTKSTIETANLTLKRLAKLCDITNPEEVKATITKQNWCNNTKRSVVIYLKSYYRFLGIKWQPPKYRAKEKLPFIPTEEELTALTTGCSNYIATLLQFLKETGVRIGEALTVKWTDIDIERRTAHIPPEKHSNPRILPLSINLVNMINQLPRQNDHTFYRKYRGTRESY